MFLSIEEIGVSGRSHADASVTVSIGYVTGGVGGSTSDGDFRKEGLELVTPQFPEVELEKKPEVSRWL